MLLTHISPPGSVYAPHTACLCICQAGSHTGIPIQSKLSPVVLVGGWVRPKNQQTRQANQYWLIPWPCTLRRWEVGERLRPGVFLVECSNLDHSFPTLSSSRDAASSTHFPEVT